MISSVCTGPLVLKGYIWNDRGHALPAPKQKQQTPVLFCWVNHAIINIFFHDSHLKGWWLLLILLPCESVVPWEAVWPTSPISAFLPLQNHILSLSKCSTLHSALQCPGFILTGAVIYCRVWKAAPSCGEFGWTKCSTVGRDLIPEKRDVLLSKALKEVVNEASISEKMSWCWT